MKKTYQSKIEKIYSKDGQAEIVDAVKNAELKSSGEIVPMIVNQCSSYKEKEPQLFLIFSSITFLIAFIIAIIIKFVKPLSIIPFNTLSISLFVLSVVLINALWVLLINKCFSFKKLFISKKYMNRVVQEKAKEQFYAKGIDKTRDKTGILIFISIIEKKVVILADNGINEKVDSSYWQNRVNEIIQGIRTKTAPLALCNAITEIGNELAKYFPIKVDDTDELKNIIIEEKI